MGKVGKTFTCDVKVLVWLEEHARKNNMKESALVNGMLRSAMRLHQSWICSKCGGTNGNDSKVCYADIDCDGVKPPEPWETV